MAHATEAGAIAAAMVASSSVLNVLFVADARLFASFAGVAIKRATLGIGPRLFSVPFAEGQLEVRLIPMNGYVEFAGANAYAEDPTPAPPRVLWNEASLPRRALAFFVAPRVFTIAIVAAGLGPSRAGAAIVAGVTDMFAAFYGAGPLLDRAAAVFAQQGFFALAALTLAKCVSYQLVNLPIDLLMLSGPTHAKAAAKVRALFMLLWLVVWAAWLIALVRWAL